MGVLTADSLPQEARSHARWMLDQLASPTSPSLPHAISADARQALARVGLGPLTTRFATGTVPAEARALALQVFATNCAFRELARHASDGLAEAGVRAVFVKGAAQLVRTAEWWRMRPMSDLDLLVERTAASAAREVLRDLGFHSESAPKPSAVWEGQQELVRRTPDGVVRLDLHRGLHHWPIWAPLSDAVLASAQRVDQVWVPSAEAGVVLAAAHRARHAYRVDARELIDVALALRESPDVAETLRLAETTQCVGALWSLLDEVLALLGQVSDAHVSLLERARASTPLAARAATSALRRATSEAARRGVEPRFWSLYLGLPAAGVSSGRAALGFATHGVLRTADVVVGAFGNREQ